MAITLTHFGIFDELYSKLRSLQLLLFLGQQFQILVVKKLSRICRLEQDHLLKQSLDTGQLAINIDLDAKEKEDLKQFFLITAKPYFIVVNVDEDTYQKIENWK